jgi:hypothetical protein
VFTNATIYLNGGLDTWRLCRYPPCSICQISPEAITFHVDCFQFLKRSNSTLTLSSIWLAGLWSHPWAGPCYQSQVSWETLPAAAAPTDLELETFLITVNRLENLPPEVFQIVRFYSPEALLWRNYDAPRWLPKDFAEFVESKLVTLTLRDLPEHWRRGTVIPSSGQNVLRERKFVRVSLDGEGIREVQFFSTWPEASSTDFPVKGKWYILLGLDDAKFWFEMKVTDIQFYI